MSDKIADGPNESGRNFLIAFLALVVLIFGLVPLVLNETSLLQLTATSSSTTTCVCTATAYVTSVGNHGSTNSSEIIQNYVNSTSCPTLSTTGLSLSNESGNNQMTDLAFLMKAGSTATICLAYPLEGEPSAPVTIDFSGFQILQVVATPVPNQGGESGYSYSYSPATGITETASPGVLTIPAGFNESQIIVNYTITSTLQARGFYTLSYYETCPPLIPFSVGYGTAQVNASDFPGFFLASSCTIQSVLSDPQIVGFGGMGTMVLSP